MKFDKAAYETSKSKQLISCECDYCGAQFERTKHYLYVSLKRKQASLFCSKDCSHKYGSKKHDYNQNCKTCGLKVDYPKVFCNHSCAAKFTNKGATRARGIKKEVNCSSCAGNIKVSVYASVKSYICDLCKTIKVKSVKVNREKLRIKKINCSNCGNEFEPLTKKTKTCSAECKRLALIRAAKRGGRKSVLSQQRRSKNEIYFYNLCKNKFSNVLHNEQIFNGWDADVILPDLKIAILWNGPWHYKKITQKHSLAQVQNRDKLKIKEIEKCGYLPYIIKDMGIRSKKKIEGEFDIFCKWLNDRKIAGLGNPPSIAFA